jgi:DNA-binding transcriptional MerR regulator
MEYTVSRLAKLAGISARTLRYYDGFGLLKPRRVSENGYRVYGAPEVARLQQIMFYRELGVELGEIKRILAAPEFEPLAALNGHLEALKVKRGQLDALIRSVEMSVSAMKGELEMTDAEKFECFKQELIDGNEREYGAEIRGKYGGGAIDRSNAKLTGMTKDQFAEIERLTAELNGALKAAFEQGDPAGPLARNACELHKRWLCLCWEDGAYSKEAHLGITRMYVDDGRFSAYYDKIVPGCAAFLREAVSVYCG